MLQPLNVNIWVTPSQTTYIFPQWFRWFSTFLPTVFNNVVLKLINSRLTCLRECFQNLLDLFHISILEKAHENVWNKQTFDSSIRCQCNVLIGAKGDAWCTAVSESTLAKATQKLRKAFNSVLGLSSNGRGSGVWQLPAPPLEDAYWPCKSEAEYNSYGSYSRRIFRH